MTNSDFWRDLFDQFEADLRNSKALRADDTYVCNKLCMLIERGAAELPPTDLFADELHQGSEPSAPSAVDTNKHKYGECDDIWWAAVDRLAAEYRSNPTTNTAIAKFQKPPSGETKLQPNQHPDLLSRWFEELRKEDLWPRLLNESLERSNQQSNQAMTEAEYAESLGRADIEAIYKASASLCLKLEDRARKAAQIPRPNLTEPFSENPPSNLGLGKWADELLPDLQRLVKHLRTSSDSAPPKRLREEFPRVFTQVIDYLPQARQERLFEQARGGLIRVPDLMDVLAEVKHLTGSTLIEYRKQYRRENGLTRIASS